MTLYPPNRLPDHFPDRPSDLTPASFAGYSAGSRQLAVEHLPLLRTMPLSLLPSYLDQVQQYDSLFPIEQRHLRQQLDTLQQQPALMQPFASIVLPPQLAQIDWLHRPGVFLNALSGALWQTHQIDRYHKAAEDLFAVFSEQGSTHAGPASRQGSASSSAAQPAPMLIAVLGQGARADTYPLFTRLRAQGMLATQLQGDNAGAMITAALSKRAAADPMPYAHWYIDGGHPWPVSDSLKYATSTVADADASAAATGPAAATTALDTIQRFTYPQLAPVTAAVLHEMDRAVQQGTGPEALADRLREMSPADLGLAQVTQDPRLARFFVQVLTQGSGTQLYSTSFVQAAAVELIRRAQPQTLLIRFAPRRKPASMNDMLEQLAQSPETDPEGALIDADMALYYAWLAVKKHPNGAHATLLAYAENQGTAFLAGPAITRGVLTTTPLTMQQALALLG